MPVDADISHKKCKCWWGMLSKGLNRPRGSLDRWVGLTSTALFRIPDEQPIGDLSVSDRMEVMCAADVLIVGFEHNSLHPAEFSVCQTRL